MVDARMDQLRSLSNQCAHEFAKSFLGQTVQVLVEPAPEGSETRHGRCERYFDVHFASDRTIAAGDLLTVRVDQVTPKRVHGTVLT
jgi:tRNA A37 methylthiotransferase MiaB